MDELSQGEQKEDYVLEFKFWMYVECLLFLGTLASNLVFMMLRQCSKSQLIINSNNGELVKPKRQLSLLISSYVGILVATLSILYLK